MRELLLNALIIFISILCYQVSWFDKSKKETRNEWIISLLAIVSILLCMTFPLRTLSGGYIYDLRFVPITLALLYGGYRSWFLVSFIYLAYRYYLGGNGVYPASFHYVLLSSILLILSFKWPGLVKKRKIILGMLLIFIASLTLVSVLSYHQLKTTGLLGTSDIQFFIIYVIINVCTMWVSLYLIHEMKEKKELREEIHRAEKMHVLSELAASVAHEVRNPLTVVDGFMQLFIKNQIEESKREEYLKLMLTELHRAQSIITDYLSFAKPEMAVQEKFNVKPLIQQTVTIMSSLATLHRVEIQSSLSINDSTYLTANPAKIKQCLINIMKNGIEAMDKGGILQVNVKEENHNLIIDIIDTGKGMTPEEVERFGMPFYSTKEKGTGLGIMVSYGIIKALDGKIKIESEEDKGTWISIILPLYTT